MLNSATAGLALSSAMAKKKLSIGEVSRRRQHRAEAKAHLAQLAAVINHLDYVDLRAFKVNALDAPIAALQALANAIRAHRFDDEALTPRKTAPGARKPSCPQLNSTERWARVG